MPLRSYSVFVKNSASILCKFFILLFIFIIFNLAYQSKAEAAVTKWVTHRTTETVDSVPISGNVANMSETAQEGASQTTTQATFGNSTGYYNFKPGTSNSGTGTPGSTATGFGFWTTNGYLSTSSSANWTFKVNVTDSRAGATCLLRVQVFSSPNRDPANATLLFNTGDLANDMCTGTTASFTQTYNPGALNLTTAGTSGTAKYLFFEYWVDVTVAGTGSSNIKLNIDGTSDTSVTPENTNAFTLGANVVGVIFDTTETVSLSVAGLNIPAYKNGSLCTSCGYTSVNNIYYAGISTPSTGDVITTYINGSATYKAVNISKYTPGNTEVNGKNYTLGNLYRDRVAIAGSQSISVTDMGNWDNDNDTDLLFYSNASTFTCRGDTSYTGLCVDTGKELHIGITNNATTFAPGGNVTTDALHLTNTATYTGGSETLLITGSGTGACISGSRPFCITSGGTFTASSNTTRFTGTSTTEIESTTYNNLEFKPAGTPTYKLGSATSQTINVNGNLVVGDSSNSVTIDWETYDPALNIVGDVTLNTPSTWTKSSTATMTLKPAGTKTVTDSNSTKQDLGIVSIASGSSTPKINMGGALKVTSMSIASSHELNANGTTTLTLTGTGTPFSNSGTFTYSTGTVEYAGNGSVTVLEMSGTSATNGYYNLDLKPTSGTRIYTLATTTGQSFAINNNFTIGGGGGTITVKEDTQSPDINLYGDLTINTSVTWTKSATSTFTFKPSGTHTWTDNTGSGNQNQDIGVVVIGSGSSTPKINLGSHVTATSININSSHELNVNGTRSIYLTGTGTPFVVGGTFTYSTGTVYYTANGSANVTALSGSSGTNGYYNLTLQTVSTGTGTYTLGTAGGQTLQINSTFTVGDDTNTVSADGDTWDPTLTILNGVFIKTNATFVASATATVTIAGGWSNTGTFTHSSGKITFNGSGSPGINAGGTTSTKAFYDVEFNSGTAIWTFTSNCKADHNLTLTNASAFNVNSGITLEIDGIYSFTDTMPTKTTFPATSVLYLNSGTAYTIGSKTQSAETYGILQIGANTDIRMWKSSATTYTVDSTGSLYSQNHGNSNGVLDIWGDFNAGTNEYWSYATNFDGVSLSGGSERTVTVNIDPAAIVTIASGKTLAAVGGSSNRTVVTRQGASNGYNIIVSGGTINFQYANFDYLDGNKGIDIQSGSTVTSLANTKYNNLIGTGGTDDAFITVDTAVIGAANTTFAGCQFDNTGSGAEFNVNRTGSDPAGSWTFQTTTGTFDGEAFDGNAGANEADPGKLIWDDSSGGGNTAPDFPTSLAQKKTDDTVIATGDWVNVSDIKFVATATDPDASDTLQLCVEKDILGVTFSDTEDLCGSGVAYTTGSPATVTVTITGITDANEYHWHARVKDAAAAYSTWVSYDVNAESARDFGIDTTAPTGGTVYDGTVTSTDALFNDGSLSSLSANWDGFNFNVSAILKYEYSIGTTPGGTDIKGWTNNTTTTSVTATSLTLHSSEYYYVNVKAYDNAGNTSTVSSNGQVVAPTLSFTVSSPSIAFANLNSGNSYTDTKTTTITTSTNAYNGYVIKLYKTDSLRSTIAPANTIGDFDGGSYASPGEWFGSNYGVGYTSDDTSIQGSDIFNAASCAGGGTAPCYAPFSSSAPGDIVADHTSAVSGSPISSEQFVLTYKVKTQTTQVAGPYSTILVYTIIPQY